VNTPVRAFRQFASASAVAAVCALICTLFCVLAAGEAQAQPIRVYVALTGADSSPCTFAQPCKSAQHAHDVVAAGGEIRMLDAGSFGLMTITKSVSILGDGHGGIAAQSGATAITINAGPADIINLRGLVIEGFSTGLHGITFNTGSALIIEDSVVRRFTDHGINFAPSSGGTLDVLNTVVANNGQSGIQVEPVSQLGLKYFVSFTRVHAFRNGNGIVLRGSSMASTASIAGDVIDCVASNNSNLGFAAVSSSGSAVLTVLRSVSLGNLQGLNTAQSSTGQATATVAQSDLSHNINAIATGQVLTYGDNYVGGAGLGASTLPRQ
jgi:hypothetical protein